MKRLGPLIILIIGIALIVAGRWLDQAANPATPSQPLFVSWDEIKNGFTAPIAASSTQVTPDVIPTAASLPIPNIPIPNLPPLPSNYNAGVASAVQQVAPFMPQRVANTIATSLPISPTMMPSPTTEFMPTAAIIPLTPTPYPTFTPVTQEQTVSGHCTEWANGNCVIQPTATMAPTYEPPPTTEPTMTPLPPTPTITQTPLPESNSISSIVTLQGAMNHGNTTIIATDLAGVATHASTNENGHFQLVGLDKGSYQLAAYSANGSHLPACTTITVGGNESITIPQTMLRAVNFSAGTSHTDETINIGAAALVAIEFGLSIPEHLVPILDVSEDGIVNETDTNMLMANPHLLACQAW